VRRDHQGARLYPTRIQLGLLSPAPGLALGNGIVEVAKSVAEVATPVAMAVVAFLKIFGMPALSTLKLQRPMGPRQAQAWGPAGDHTSRAIMSDLRVGFDLPLRSKRLRSNAHAIQPLS
jgi:hypothetical protein